MFERGDRCRFRETNFQSTYLRLVIRLAAPLNLDWLMALSSLEDHFHLAKLYKSESRVRAMYSFSLTEYQLLKPKARTECN